MLLNFIRAVINIYTNQSGMTYYSHCMREEVH